MSGGGKDLGETMQIAIAYPGCFDYPGQIHLLIRARDCSTAQFCNQPADGERHQPFRARSDRNPFVRHGSRLGHTRLELYQVSTLSSVTSAHHRESTCICYGGMVSFQEIGTEGESYVSIGKIKNWECRDTKGLIRRLRQSGPGLNSLVSAVTQSRWRSQGCCYLGDQIGQVIRSETE